MYDRGRGGGRGRGIREAEVGAGVGPARLICMNACCKPQSLYGPLSSTTSGAGEGGPCSRLCSFFEIGKDGRGLEFGGVGRRVCEESRRGGAARTLTMWGGCAGE